ncbi:MAG: hypothetical protein ACYCS7_04880 [Acidimicrobiales bacterium]
MLPMPRERADQPARFGQAPAGPALTNPVWTWGIASEGLTTAFDPTEVPDNYFLVDAVGQITYQNSVPVGTMSALLTHLHAPGRGRPNPGSEHPRSQRTRRVGVAMRTSSNAASPAGNDCRRLRLPETLAKRLRITLSLPHRPSSPVCGSTAGEASEHRGCAVTGRHATNFTSAPVTLSRPPTACSNPSSCRCYRAKEEKCARAARSAVS